MILLTIILILLTDIVLKPRLEFTREGKLLLFYNYKKTRKYIVIMR